MNNKILYTVELITPWIVALMFVVCVLWGVGNGFSMPSYTHEQTANFKAGDTVYIRQNGFVQLRVVVKNDPINEILIVQEYYITWPYSYREVRNIRGIPWLR